jgi:flagellar motility protein MotE (MotC chaperone)
MRIVRTIVLAGIVLKVALIGSWWWSVTRPAYAAREGADPSPDLPSELLERTRGFHDLLDAVRQRGADLDQREQSVAAREATLKALEKTIADEVTRLESLTKSATPASSPGGAPTVGVTKVYESMKAEEAAPILDKLDDATALGILGRMKERQVGAILAAMNRDRAVELTRALSGTRRQ